MYVCGTCWASFPEAARRALNHRDNRALLRLRELHHHIDLGLPLAQLEITP
ncbi:hypothetical protein ACIP5N_33960 [Streptomyces sp. NPDC088768]|uniref:hypothetical protein n=1 Tax=Streptomyces sp. NPDC088768 TaxID=3365894 RepID=UPI00380ED73F